MSSKLKFIVDRLWRWFRRRSKFIQLLIIFPFICAVALTVLIGNMGLALMGTAVALYAPLVGWFGGVFALILWKAGLIVAKDRQKAAELKKSTD